MGVIGRIIGWWLRIIGWGQKKGLKDIKKKIQKAIESKRLIFQSDDSILFIDKQGRKGKYTFGKAVSMFIATGGWANRMTDLGLTHQDIKDVLMQEYEKQKKEV